MTASNIQRSPEYSPDTPVADATAPRGLLQVEGVTKSYQRAHQRVPVLRDAHLVLERGEFLALTGPSGSGKSTLLHLAGGLDTPDEGTVRFDGADLGTLTADQRAAFRRRNIGFVFQFFHLLGGMTVIENVALPLVLDRSKRARARAAELVERVGLAGRENDHPAQLSGGEMQRVAIARALVARPELIVADEPTGNLDSVTGTTIMDLLVEEVTEAGAALLLVTHDPIVAARAHRTMSVRDGRVE
jgi:ABC-type lipoprotein export system ATPase subunit